MPKKKTWQKLIDQVLGGKLDSVDLAKPYVTPCEVVDYLESLGLEAGDMDRNGWEGDFWQGFCLAGQEPEIVVENIGGREYTRDVYPFMFAGVGIMGTSALGRTRSKNGNADC